MSSTSAEISSCTPIRNGTTERSTVPVVATPGPIVCATTQMPKPTPHATSARPTKKKSAIGENERIVYFQISRFQKPRKSSQPIAGTTRRSRMPETSSP